MFEKRKGITPVIAIVLLLLVTVGAVGVVYTQFQNIADQGNTQFNTKARQTAIQITAVSKNNDNEMNLTITNKQDSVTINTSKMLQIQYYPDEAGSGSSVPFSTLPLANIDKASGASATCFSDSRTGVILDPGESYTCDTNVKWPEATTYVGMQVNVQGGSNSWTKECEPTSSSSPVC
ncbi:MAG: hypothetical protein ABEJ95_07160 [Candidatus Nanohalobium sp.]